MEVKFYHNEKLVGETTLDAIPRKGGTVYLYVFNKSEGEVGLPWERLEYKVEQVNWVVDVGRYHFRGSGNRVDIHLELKGK